MTLEICHDENRNEVPLKGGETNPLIHTSPDFHSQEMGGYFYG